MAKNEVEKLRSVPFKIRKGSTIYKPGIWYINEINSSGEVCVASVPNWDGDEEKGDVEAMAWVDPNDLIPTKTKK